MSLLGSEIRLTFNKTALWSGNHRAVLFFLHLPDVGVRGIQKARRKSPLPERDPVSPHTNEQPAELFVALHCGAVLFAPLILHQNKKSQADWLGIYGGELGTRTPDPLRVMQVL